MIFRNFDQHIDDKASECASNPYTAEPFDIIDPARQGGGTGAVKVKMQASQLIAWAKPEGAGNAHIRDVAHEKIAADLGLAFNLPVAPVAVSAKTTGKNLHPIVALSYEALRMGRPLAQIPPDASLKLRGTLSAMFVFLAFIDDHDHFGGANAHFEIVNGEPRVAYFDWGHSLTRAWTIPGPPADRPQWKNPPQPFAPLDLAAADAILQRIEGFPIKDLERIITGVPLETMPADVQNNLVRALDQRRRVLRTVLNLTGAP